MKTQTETDLPTVAPGALLLVDRPELCAHLSPGLRGMEARSLWNDLITRLALAQPNPATN